MSHLMIEGEEAVQWIDLAMADFSFALGPIDPPVLAPNAFLPEHLVYLPPATGRVGKKMGARKLGKERTLKPLIVGVEINETRFDNFFDCSYILAPIFLPDCPFHQADDVAFNG